MKDCIARVDNYSLNSVFFLLIVTLLMSCGQQQDFSKANQFTLKVVPAIGYKVPADSLQVPQSVPAGKPTIVKAGKPEIVPIGTNVVPAGEPFPIEVGNPTGILPGTNGIALPETKTAIHRPVMAVLPKVVLAKEPEMSDPNPQNFMKFGKLHGLKSDRVQKITQDKKGNLWFGTNGGGVTKYDGKGFLTFTNKEGLIDNNVISILEDSQGNFWFGTYNGLSKYDGKSFTNYTEKEGLVQDIVVSLEEDRQGNIWVGTNGGFSIFDGISFYNYTERQGLSSKVVYPFCKDKLGNVWMGTSDRGLIKYDGMQFLNYSENNGLDGSIVTCITSDQNGTLWFGTSDGLLKFDGKRFWRFPEKEGLNENVISSIFADKKGNIWFSTIADGVLKYDGKNFTNFTAKEGLNVGLLRGTTEDRNGNIWFATFGGAYRFGGHIFTHLTEKEGLKSSIIRSVLKAKSGNIWIIGADGSTTKYDGKTLIHYSDVEDSALDRFKGLLEDRSGNIWFGTWVRGVSRFDGKEFAWFTKDEGVISNKIHCLTEDHLGNIWVGSEEGVSKFDGKVFTHFTEKEGLGQDRIYAMLADRSGSIWFGTENNGLSQLDSDGKSWTHYNVSGGLSHNGVWCLWEDLAGNIWIGTWGGGLSILDKGRKTFTHITEKEGLSSDHVSSIMQDKSGNFWIGTQFGLNKISGEIIQTLSSTNTISYDYNEIIKTYTYSDGFAGIGVKSHSLVEDDQGAIWIGTDDRLTVFTPEGDNTDTIAPYIQLTGIGLFNENVTWAKDTSFILGNGVPAGDFQFDSLSRWYPIPHNLSLAYNNNYLTFHFVGITTNSPHKVRYQYMLEGLENNWNTPTERSEATFGNLPPGNYTFRVKAKNGDGYWSGETLYLFTIRPPWWWTWWAYTVYLILFIIVVVRIHFIQKARTIRQEREKTRERDLEQAKEIEMAYKELGTAHEHLKSTQSQLIQSEKMASLGELTAGIAHEIQNPLNFVNNFSELSYELVDEMNEELENGDKEEAKFISFEIKENLNKILHHGKRADAIVKGMLEHSRASTGERVPTDINGLCDEYLRLSFHGMRARDKSFNAYFITDFDPLLPKVNVVPQDFGRVLLNLINNAFQACSTAYSDMHRSSIKSSPSTSINPNSSLNNHASAIINPLVTVSTTSIGDKIQISIQDNGVGIPDHIKDKIFQPFFTTKPTGQGTGLGLSLAYDIVKAHGGELEVISTEGAGSTFIIKLPRLLKNP